jgi:hypothetical protein
MAPGGLFLKGSHVEKVPMVPMMWEQSSRSTMATSLLCGHDHNHMTHILLTHLLTMAQAKAKAKAKAKTMTNRHQALGAQPQPPSTQAHGHLQAAPGAGSTDQSMEQQWEHLATYTGALRQQHKGHLAEAP